MKHVLLGGVLAVWSAQVAADTASVIRPPEKRSQAAQLQVDHPVVTQVQLSVVPQGPQVVSNTRAAPDIGPDAGPDTEQDFGPHAAPDVTRDFTTRIPQFFTDLRPPARSGHLPRTRWQHMSGHEVWTRAALSALKKHGKPLVDMVPDDIDAWCPAYETATETDRRAFWVGFLSALSKHESTYKPWAVGGGGRWYGLLQILPGTARGYDCNVGTGEALKNGAANLSCAVRIMAVTVPRDGVIYGPGGRGVAADWGPMRSAAKRGDIAGWLKRQNYCKPLDATRPRPRP